MRARISSPSCRKGILLKESLDFFLVGTKSDVIFSYFYKVAILIYDLYVPIWYIVSHKVIYRFLEFTNVHIL